MTPLPRPRHIGLARTLGTLLAAAAFVHAAPQNAPSYSLAEIEFFENRIRPVLAEKCDVCHSGDRPQGNLRLDFRGGWEQGGKSGPAVVRGEPEKSPLILAIRHEGATSPMPLGGGKLDADVIAAFEDWIRMGAPDPRDEAAAAPRQEKTWSEIFEERSHWWSLQPVKKTRVPGVKHTQWSDQPVDRFILARLESEGLTPAPQAERYVLLRRLSFTLTGLPPTPEEISVFLEDRQPGAYERAVDRLLASPHFGERWARHWMDVVRYSDTYGYEWDIPAKGAWRYRDYLIRAFNQDVPYDQLAREQIAGDLLPAPRINPTEQINESLIGPMFYQMGENRHGDSLQFNGISQEMLNNKIDAFSKAFQAMTVACARCHDHKLDAISQKDYYALGGVFMSSRWVSNTLDTGDRNRETLERLSALKPKLREAVSKWWLEDAPNIPRYLRAALACVNSDRNAAELAQGLDPIRLAAWNEVVLDADAASEPALGNLVYPWLQLNRSVKEGETVSAAWQRLAEQYRQASGERTSNNAREFEVIADFSKGVPDGWSIDGVGLQQVNNGDFVVDLDGRKALKLLLPAGLYTNSLSPRLNGAIRTPYLNHSGREHLSMQVAGGDFSAHRLIVDNAFLTERQQYLKNAEPYWVRLSTTAAEKTNRPQTDVEVQETRVYVEVATKTSNPNFPPRVGLGGKCTDEQAADPRSWFGITKALLHDKEEEPADELTRFESLFGGDAPVDLAAAAARYEQWLANSIEAWANDRASEDDVHLINWMLTNRLLPNELAMHKPVRTLVTTYQETERQLANPWTVNGMADLDAGNNYRLNERGVYEDLGDSVPRGYVEVLAGKRDAANLTGSGRLELAEAVANPANPLTARVFVNRVWHWVFGAGLVTTPDDFGHLGERPSHPELLDYLAGWFVENDWSTKKLVRLLVTSETFRQSNEVSARGRDADPDNRLLHYYRPRRLDA
ncbi:MAG: PSD1 and planctomycete cytochrome C domain-containing protein, partial [Acidobacteria bacterium]|nr:PSD1 and planctomycete cytochrome C domain-containing protein [Acidobacteriota bacterium]